MTGDDVEGCKEGRVSRGPNEADSKDGGELNIERGNDGLWRLRSSADNHQRVSDRTEEARS